MPDAPVPDPSGGGDALGGDEPLGGGGRLDPRSAAELFARTEREARSALRVSPALLNLIWGMAWLIGLGAMWLSVVRQRPYTGPSGPASAVLGVGLVAAMAITITVSARAGRGVGGRSVLRWLIYSWSWPVGFGGLFTILGAAAKAGASPRVTGVLYAAGPFLVTGLIYVLAAAIVLSRRMFALGVWLVLVGAAGAWTGPVTVLLIGALAGGGGFLVAAVADGGRGGRGGGDGGRPGDG